MGNREATMASLCELLFSCHFTKQLLGTPFLSKIGKISIHHRFPPFYKSQVSLCTSPSNSLKRYGSSLVCCCSEKPHAHQLFEEFNEMCIDVPWEVNDVWSTFVGYLFMLHVPLSFGGLSLVSSVLHKPTLDPLTMVVSTAGFQSLELFGTLSLLQYATRTDHDFYRFMIEKMLLPKSNWVKKTAIGIGFLITFVSVTSILADMLIGPMGVNDPIEREILSSGPASQLILFFLYCISSPVLEETVYRGFLLTSLATKSKPWQAIVLSSCMFTLAHFSFDDSLQLFVVGCVFGYVYCWTGSLVSSIVVHSVYNAVIFLMSIV